MLIICSECGKEYSDQAKTCVHCGAMTSQNRYISNNTRGNNYHNGSYPRKNSSNGFFVFILIVVIFILCIIIFPNVFNIGNSTTEKLEKEVQTLIIDKWKESGLYKNTDYTIKKDLVLTKKKGNEYSGIIEIVYKGKTFQVLGTVIYDGYYVQWLPDRNNLLYQIFQ